ncbi:MAG: RdgB/HAM1 family non-canonical purine NTP pyrophosphatase [Clostridiaceae bacterium]|jgi:XTP/dITP diphosphohydrolase|nr:RdgB/HAM1 family non-canonical purine NTP pyrophosphatase [Clostridiaceae bacterium]
MKRLIIATKNNGKVNEIKSLLSGYEYEVLSLKEAGIDIEIEENGDSFEENSLIKAMAVHKITGEMVVADDSGLEVDFLNGAPGIYSARFLNNVSDKQKYEGVLALMEGIPDEYRSARFKCAVSLVTDTSSKTFTGNLEGKIAYKAIGENGFGYDPVFYIPEYNQTMAQIDLEIKNSISHRARAFKQLADTLKNWRIP